MWKVHIIITFFSESVVIEMQLDLETGISTSKSDNENIINHFDNLRLGDEAIMKVICHVFTAWSYMMPWVKISSHILQGDEGNCVVKDCLIYS